MSHNVQVIRVAKGRPPDITHRVTSDPNSQPPVFVEMQKNMEDELDQRRKDWEKEVEKMQQDFFHLKPGEKRKKMPAIQQAPAGDSKDVSLNSSTINPIKPIPADSRDMFDLSNTKALYTDMPDGSKMFRMRFDVRGFEPDEISVRAEGEKVTVTAERTEEHGKSNKNVRQFNRAADIPDDVDPDALVSSLSSDGILTVEAPVMKGIRPSGPAGAEDTGLDLYSTGGLHSQIIDFDRPHQFLDSPVEYTRVIERSHGGGGSRVQPRQDRIKHHVVESSGPVNGGMKVITPSKYRREKAATETSRCGDPNVVNTEYGKKLRIEVNLGEGYDPADVKIVLHDYRISVNAKREETVRGRSIRREFSREFDIPEPINKRYFIAKMTKAGRMVMGGSLESNENHEMVLQSVYNDLPIYGTNIKPEDAN